MDISLITLTESFLNELQTIGVVKEYDVESLPVKHLKTFELACKKFTSEASLMFETHKQDSSSRISINSGELNSQNRSTGTKTPEVLPNAVVVNSTANVNSVPPATSELQIHTTAKERKKKHVHGPHIIVCKTEPLSDAESETVTTSLEAILGNACLTTAVQELPGEVSSPSDHREKRTHKRPHVTIESDEEESSVQPVVESAFQKEVLHSLKKYSKSMQVMKTQMKSLMTHYSTPDPRTSTYSGLPVQTVQELCDFNTDLADEKIFAAVFVTLRRKGGHDARDVIRKLCACIMTNEVGKCFNWLGRRGNKLAFSMLKNVFSLLHVIAEYHVKNVSEADVEKLVKMWLVHAAERETLHSLKLQRQSL